MIELLYCCLLSMRAFLTDIPLLSFKALSIHKCNTQQFTVPVWSAGINGLTHLAIRDSMEYTYY